MKFVGILFLTVITCTAVLLIAFIVYKNGFNNYYSAEEERLQHIINGKERHDILFLGSSRMIHQVNPRVVDSVTKLNCYNAGADGANLLEMNFILQCYLTSHPSPKILAIDLAITSFTIKQTPFFNPNIYFPYLSNPVVYNALKPYEKVFLLRYVPFVQLTEADDFLKQNALLGCVGKKSQYSKDNYKGFLPYGADTISLPFRATYLTTNFEVGKAGKSILNQMIQTCKKNNIKPIIIYSPVYDKKDEPLNPDLFPTIEEVCAQYNIPFLNYRNESALRSNRFFKDEHHLNKLGANIYSAILANDLNQWLRLLKL